MQEISQQVDLRHEVDTHGMPSALFVARVLRDGLPEVHAGEWTTSARSLAGLGDALFRYSSEGRDATVIGREDALVHVELYGGRVYAEVAGNDREALDAALADLRRLLPAPDPTSTHEVPVTFWTYGPHGPQPASRSIAVPSWDEIRENYAQSTRERLDAIMRGFRPAHGGQLILWHGKAGTGKTFGLRALAWEWRDWCDFHYVVDPDAFFGQRADYLMGVLLQRDYAELALHPVGDTLALDHAERPWRVLILEDAGELLTPDARATVGQGLSRFLNVVDGLIGQGLRVLVLVTTNEEVRRLHPAVARPGRCAATVEFELLSRAEASAWLERRGVGERDEAPSLLATLYARLGGVDDVAELPRAAGFAL